MVSPWVTLGLLFAFAAIWAWLARNLTPNRLLNLQGRGLRELGAGKFDDARTNFADLLSEARFHKRGRDLTVSALTFLAAIDDLKGDPAKAAEAWELAAAERGKSATRFDTLIATQLAGLASGRNALNKLPAADSLSGHALELAEQSPDAGEGALVVCLRARAQVLMRLKQPGQAVALLERSWSIAANFGPDDPRPVQVQTDLATALWRQKNFERAADLFDHAIAGLEVVVTNKEFVPDALVSLHRLRGRLANQLGLREKAYEHYDRAVKLGDMTGEEDTSLAISLTYRGSVGAYLGRHDQAEPDLKRAIDLFRKIKLADDPNFLSAQVAYASLQCQTGRHEKAIRLASHVLAVLETAREVRPDEQDDDEPAPVSVELTEVPLNELVALTVLARAHFDRGQFEVSEPFARRAVAAAEQHLPDAGMPLARNLHRLALIHARRGDVEGSGALFQRAIAAYERLEDQSELVGVIQDRDHLVS